MARIERVNTGVSLIADEVAGLVRDLRCFLRERNAPALGVAADRIHHRQSLQVYIRDEERYKTGLQQGFKAVRLVEQAAGEFHQVIAKFDMRLTEVLASDDERSVRSAPTEVFGCEELNAIREEARQSCFALMSNAASLQLMMDATIENVGFDYQCPPDACWSPRGAVGYRQDRVEVVNEPDTDDDDDAATDMDPDRLRERLDAAERDRSRDELKQVRSEFADCREEIARLKSDLEQARLDAAQAAADAAEETDEIETEQPTVQARRPPRGRGAAG